MRAVPTFGAIVLVAVGVGYVALWLVARPPNEPTGRLRRTTRTANGQTRCSSIRQDEKTEGSRERGKASLGRNC